MTAQTGEFARVQARSGTRVHMLTVPASTAHAYARPRVRARPFQRVHARTRA